MSNFPTFATVILGTGYRDIGILGSALSALRKYFSRTKGETLPKY